ncbi:MAG: hypothetical protein KC421_15510 [Anaerolineales bacterium]|nr:hypothetical protein [Anaerolineales bacterium]
MTEKVPSLSKENRTQLYAAAQYINSTIEKELGLQIPFDVYLQDPLVAKNDPMFGFNKNFFVRWEPGFANGPTSSRFAIVDFDGDTGKLAPPAEWDEDLERFVFEGKVLDRNEKGRYQFHQVNVWAALQRALDFYQGPWGLGRMIPWGFEGNRLIVVPHAGYGKNAYYDRHSKSLQFYYFKANNNQTVYTSLATDIINHEFGHAILDGIRPYYLEDISVETAAFHEFIGDLTAILIILRNNEFRRGIADKYKGNLGEADELAFIAEQFGKEVQGKPYLRSANNPETMSKKIENKGPHEASQILTGTMFQILKEISKRYLEERKKTAKQAFYYACERMQRTAIQPLDLLPPVDVTFKDYALAVLRAEALSDPTDPHNYYELMLKVFVDRKILDRKEATELLESRHSKYLNERFAWNVYPNIVAISQSRIGAYHFLNDNREALYIPRNQDLIVADVYEANKFGRGALRLPRQIIVEYIWREDIKLEGAQYGQFNGKMVQMLCGGTLVFDEHANLLYWSRKPGTELAKEKRHYKKGSQKEKDWENELKQGDARRKSFLAYMAKRIKTGQVDFMSKSDAGLSSNQVRPIIAEEENNLVHFMLSPHFSLEADKDNTGGRQWEISF